MESNTTFLFDVSEIDDVLVGETIKEVYNSLEERGYNPVNQIVGYILSGEATYITNYNGARNAIKSLERDELLENMVKEYVDEND